MIRVTLQFFLECMLYDEHYGPSLLGCTDTASFCHSIQRLTRGLGKQVILVIYIKILSTPSLFCLTVVKIYMLNLGRSSITLFEAPSG